MIDPNLLRNNLAEVAEKLKVKRNFILDKHYKQSVTRVPKPLVQQKHVVKTLHHYWLK